MKAKIMKGFDKVKKKNVSVMLDEKLINSLEEKLKIDGVSKSDFARIVMNKYINGKINLKG